MSEECSFLLVGEKHLKCQIHLMSWSPKRDLIVMATNMGEVVLHRLTSIERVWSLPAPAKDARINDICWRPDGGVIAVAYNSKENGVALIGMEKAQIFWNINAEQFSLKYPLCSLKWFESQEIKDIEFDRRMASLTFKDYLTQLPHLSSKSGKNIDVKSVIAELRFNLLLSCDEKNTIIGFSYGIFPIFTLNMPLLLFDLSSMFEDILLCNEASHKVCHLVSTLSYMDDVLDCMKESCESVIQEMESKLTNYLMNKHLSATIGDEFMHMLMWGKPSEILEDLLLRCISEKSIVKLGTLIESSYTSMQQLIMVNFLLASDVIFYHITELKGLCTPSILGNLNLFKPTQLHEITRTVGSMFLKAVEMQQVIGKNLQSFKAFFQWLYSTLLKIKGTLMDKNLQISHSQLEFVADFIMSSFIHEHEQLKLAGRERHFNLNKVDQYLQDAPLSSTVKSVENEWYHLVDTTPCLAHNPLIFDRRPNNSLQQIFLEVKKMMSSLFNEPELTLKLDNVKHKCLFSLPNASLQPRVQQWFLSEGNSDGRFFTLLFESNPPCKQLACFITNECSCTTHGMRLQISTNFMSHDQSDQSSEPCCIVDMSNYNESLMTFLLQTDNGRCLISQVSIPMLEHIILTRGAQVAKKATALSSLPLCDVSETIAQYCSVHPMAPVSVTSSGTRKISCLLGADLRYVRAYDMDTVNDDDDVDVSMATNDD